MLGAKLGGGRGGVGWEEGHVANKKAADHRFCTMRLSIRPELSALLAMGLLVTTDEVIVGKNGIFSNNIALRVPILNFRKYGVRPQGHHGPLYEAQILLRRRDDLVPVHYSRRG